MKFTSEDNFSFKKALEKIQNEKKEEYWWAPEVKDRAQLLFLPSPPAMAALEGPKEQKALPSSGSSTSSSIIPRHEITKAGGVLPPKIIRKHNTRVSRGFRQEQETARASDASGSREVSRDK